MGVPSKVLYTVRYRRSAWSYSQSRTFLTVGAARQLVRKLLGSNWDYAHLSPIVDVKLTRRPLGEEEIIEEWTPRPWRRQ
jgi:hypothetical protein